jgi:hypothetical protein
MIVFGIVVEGQRDAAVYPAITEEFGAMSNGWCRARVAACRHSVGSSWECFEDFSLIASTRRWHP